MGYHPYVNIEMQQRHDRLNDPTIRIIESLPEHWRSFLIEHMRLAGAWIEPLQPPPGPAPVGNAHAYSDGGPVKAGGWWLVGG